MPSPATTLLQALRRRLMPTPAPAAAQHAESDVDGGRFVAAIECILDQSVRDRGAARFAAMNFAVVQLCQRHGVGILQLPCPEIAALGPTRSRPDGISLRQALAGADAQQRCRCLAQDACARIEARLARGGKLLAILGGNALRTSNKKSVTPPVHRGRNWLTSALFF